MKEVYELMHGERKVVQIDTQGHCEIYEKTFLPYNLYLEETEEDIDTLVNNVTDVYWVRKQQEQITFAEINLYDNHLENTFVDVSLRGKQMTVQNQSLVRDLSTNGCFPKAWIRTEGGFRLLKDGGKRAVEDEILASKICSCFDCPQVRYLGGAYDNEPVSVSDIMTSKAYSIVSREAFEIYAQNQEIDPMEYILKLDSHTYYMMNVLDYLVGNTDRHWATGDF